MQDHFMSILNFSWPQVTYVTQCPIRGSRVVFVSFFAMSKQECSCGTMNTMSSGNAYVFENSSASECIASSGFHHRSDDASSVDSPASDQRTETPASCYHKEPVLPNPKP